MQIYNDLLNDGIINKEKLVLKRHDFIGLQKNEAIFVAKLFKNSSIENHHFTIKELASKLDISKETVQVLVKSLIASNCLKVINSSNGIIFDFDFIIEKLLESYFAPSEESALDKKIIWMEALLKFKINNDNVETIKKWIINGNWNKLVLVSKKTAMLDSPSWPLLVSAYDSLNDYKEKDTDGLKDIMNINWLEN